MIPNLDDPNAHSRAVRRAVGHRAAAVRQAWRDHNARIRPLLPPALQLLQDATLHDGLVRSLRIDAGQKTLQLRLLCDDQQGNFDLDLDYKGIQLTPQQASLICLIAYADSEVAMHEIDLDEGPGAPTFIHRISWRTGVRTDREALGRDEFGEELYQNYCLRPETELRFGGLEIEIVRRSDRHLARPEDFITVVRDPDKIAGMDEFGSGQ